MGESHDKCARDWLDASACEVVYRSLVTPQRRAGVAGAPQELAAPTCVKLMEYQLGVVGGVGCQVVRWRIKGPPQPYAT